jgi:glutathione synthase/RimK-type ligase-like ATP-grasp enzyme
MVSSKTVFNTAFVMKNIGVLWDKEVSWDGDTAFGDVIDETYEYFSTLGLEEDVQLLIGKYNWYSDGVMEKSWKFDGENWVKVEDVELDGVFDKFHFDEETKKIKQSMAESPGIINDPDLEELCKDKLMTYERFSEHVPETRKASEANIDEMLNEFGKVVLKPRFAYGAEGLHIIDRSDEVPEIENNDYIVQRFVDSSKGIDGLVEGSHDLRAILVDGEVKGCYVRYNEDSEISNVSEGGVKEAVSIDEFPDSALEIIEEVNEDIEYSPALFSVDLFFDPEGRPWIIELNSKPGLNFFGEEELKKQITPIMKALIESFRKL